MLYMREELSDFIIYVRKDDEHFLILSVNCRGNSEIYKRNFKYANQCVELWWDLKTRVYLLFERMRKKGMSQTNIIISVFNILNILESRMKGKKVILWRETEDMGFDKVVHLCCGDWKRVEMGHILKTGIWDVFYWNQGEGNYWPKGGRRKMSRIVVDPENWYSNIHSDFQTGGMAFTNVM